MTLQDCVRFLVQNGYMVQMNSLPHLTNQFYKEVVGKDVGLRIVEPEQVVVQEVIAKPKKTIKTRGGATIDASKVNWSLLYGQLILDAEISPFAYTSNGRSYRVNLSTKPGADAFKAALLEGVSYDELLQKTKSYYESTQQPVKVENFFKNEIWRNQIQDAGDSFTGPTALG